MKRKTWLQSNNAKFAQARLQPSPLPPLPEGEENDCPFSPWEKVGMRGEGDGRGEPLFHYFWRRIATTVSLIEFAALTLPLTAAAATAAWLQAGAPDEHSQRLTRARDDVRAISAALVTASAMPTTAQGLEELVRQHAVEAIPVDPWGRSYVYRNPGKIASFELYSLGADGVESQDDLVSWNLYGGR